jgi:hypothetical protein
VLPASVLFWGRRVYWALVVLLVTALRQGRVQAGTLRIFTRHLGVSRSTLERWQKFFQTIFPRSSTWRSVVARFMPPLDTGRIAFSLVERFVPCRGDPETGLATCLRTIALART